MALITGTRRSSHPRPLVIWHGLGDTYASPGIVEFQQAVEAIHPGIFIHSVYIDQVPDKDRRATYFGNVNDQVAIVADQIASIDELKDGFDAIGFSQGGQFLRAYVQRYAHAVAPVHNLITFGSQHMGIADIPACHPGDITCQLARRVIKHAIYSKWAQDNLVQAQYFRDTTKYPIYLASNTFLTDVNNELSDVRNNTYAHNLAGLDALVLILFTQDKTVVPKETAWFGSYAIPEDDDSMPTADQTAFSTTDQTIVPMRQQPLYTEDWIGLRKLDERGAVFLLTCDSEHMHIGSCWEAVVRNFTGTLV